MNLIGLLNREPDLPQVSEVSFLWIISIWRIIDSMKLQMTESDITFFELCKFGITIYFVGSTADKILDIYGVVVFSQ